jgi:uncharacterized protein involved in tolerance to divalent cations
MDYALVLMTLPASIPAGDLVCQLLEQRMIAGVNIIPDVATRYSDGSTLHDTRETIYFCRTIPDNVAALWAFVRAHTGEHDFEITVISASACNPIYS